MYKRLEIIAYSNIEEYEKEYAARLNSLATLKPNLSIRPFSKREQRRLSEEYPVFYVCLPEHMVLVEKIYNNSRELETFPLPTVLLQRLFYSQIIDEIQSTNDMEGVKSTRKEIQEAYHSAAKTKRFSGIVAMYQSILRNEFEKIDTLSKFRFIYDQLFLDEMELGDKPDGELFRKNIVYVGSQDSYVHQGNPSELSIQEDLTKLILFMNESNVPVIIKAILTHYLFEYVHPFYDGNGRMGRFLLSSYLSRKLDFLTGLSISESVLQNKRDYEQAFAITSHPKNKGDLTPFVEKLLHIILHGQENMKTKLKKLHFDVEQLHLFIETLDICDIEKEVLFVLCQDKLFDLVHKGVSNKELVSFFDGKYKRTKIDKTLKDMEVKGLVKKIKSSPIVYEVLIDLFDNI